MDAATEHVSAMEAQIANPQRYVSFVAYSNDRRPVGFAEASIRSDYVNGTHSSPVAFLEGIYVSPENRRQGVATALFAEICRWAKISGCRELASDALLENEVSHSMHRALGFTETEKVVYFCKGLP
jgi:aminoglycoside 6'-N-acetyltransferase I